MYPLKMVAIILFLFFGIGMLLCTANDTYGCDGCDSGNNPTPGGDTGSGDSGWTTSPDDSGGGAPSGDGGWAPSPGGNSGWNPSPGGNSGLNPSPGNQNPWSGSGPNEQQTLYENQKQYCPGECYARNDKWGGPDQLWNGIPTKDGTCNCVCPSGYDFDNTGRRCVAWQEGTAQCQDKCKAAIANSHWDGSKIFPNCGCVCDVGYVYDGSSCVLMGSYASANCGASCASFDPNSIWSGQFQVQNNNVHCFCQCKPGYVANGNACVPQ